jgi:3-oxoacyl-[acyl-carrier-protein] synthase-3
VTAQFVQIRAAGCYLPEQVIDNKTLIERFGLTVDAEWIVSRTGIHSRHWMTSEQSTSDMCVAAARQILDRSDVKADRLDRLILATISPDYLSPSTASIVAGRLGARCPAFDVSAACAGFLYGLDLGIAAVRGGARNVLVLAADARSRFLDPADRRSIVLFADGAAGVLLQPGDRPGFLSIWIGAEGRERMGAHIPGGGARRPATHATVAAGDHYLKIDSREEIFTLFVQFTRESCQHALDAAGLTLDDIDHFITHQGNALLVDAAAKGFLVEDRKVVNNVAHHGNTSGATVPIAFAESIASGRIQPGSRVLLTSVGAGYTFGAAVYQM